MKQLILTLVIVCISSCMFAAEPANRPEFVNQLASSDVNQNAAATAWGTTNEGVVWFLYLDESGYVKFFLNSSLTTLKSSKKFDVYFRKNQTIVIGDTISTTASKKKVVQNYLKNLEKLGLPALEVKEIIKS